MYYYVYQKNKSSIDVGIRYETGALTIDLVTVYGQTVTKTYKDVKTR